MAMSRAELVAEVGARLRRAIALLGLQETDTAGNLREPINDTFRALGVAETALLTATVADGDERRALAFAKYFVLDALVDSAHDQADLTAPGGAGLKQQQTIQSLERQRDRALVAATLHGLTGYVARTLANVAPIPLAGGIARAPYFTNYSGGGAGQW